MGAEVVGGGAFKPPYKGVKRTDPPTRVRFQRVTTTYLRNNFLDFQK
ncbi:hypothetical protein JCM17380_54940 [Desulfosporosinus burensis]